MMLRQPDGAFFMVGNPTCLRGSERSEKCLKARWLCASAPLREVHCSFIFCRDWKRVSRKAQSSVSCMSFAPLRLCVRFIVHSFSVVTGKGLTQRREGAEFCFDHFLCASAPLREVYRSFIFCRDWKRVSRKGAKAQSSDSNTSFAPLRLCVRFISHSFSTCDS